MNVVQYCVLVVQVFFLKHIVEVVHYLMNSLGLLVVGYVFLIVFVPKQGFLEVRRRDCSFKGDFRLDWY
jgi:hypothetical protein